MMDQEVDEVKVKTIMEAVCKTMVDHGVNDEEALIVLGVLYANHLAGLTVTSDGDDDSSLVMDVMAATTRDTLDIMREIRAGNI